MYPFVPFVLIMVALYVQETELLPQGTINQLNQAPEEEEKIDYLQYLDELSPQPEKKPEKKEEKIDWSKYADPPSLDQETYNIVNETSPPEFDQQEFWIMWKIKHDLDDVVEGFFAIYLTTFGILLFLNTIYRIVLNWGGNYMVRLWVFGVIVWMLGSLSLMWIVNYYEYNSVISMIEDSYPYISLIMFFPPLFVGSALFVYNKYIKA